MRKGSCKSTIKYWVSQKKLLHKREEKIHKKMKMTKKRVENFVHVQQHYGVSFYEKNVFPILVYIADMAN